MRTLNLITPVILAAGDSLRMGYPKALLPLGTDTFLTRILRVLKNMGMQNPMIILGKAAPAILPQIRAWPADVRINPDPARGQLSSVQLALSPAPAESIGILLWPVDQPAVSESLVRRLTDLFVVSESRIAVPMHGGKRGHPAIFHRDLFQEFMNEPLEKGPKGILLRHQEATAVLPTEEPAAIQDIDTPADYEALTGESLDVALARAGVPRIPQS